MRARVRVLALYAVLGERLDSRAHTHTFVYEYIHVGIEVIRVMGSRCDAGSLVKGCRWRNSRARVGVGGYRVYPYTTAGSEIIVSTTFQSLSVSVCEKILSHPVAAASSGVGAAVVVILVSLIRKPKLFIKC